MSTDPRAGQPAPRSLLVDVPRLVTDYFAVRPDPADPAQRVAFGTSGHRGTSGAASFNEAHIAAISQAVAEHRYRKGVTGPLYLGADTHALSTPALVTALEVLTANGVHVVVAQGLAPVPTPVVSHAILTHAGAAGERADGIVINVGRGSVVIRSALWDGAQVGSRCEVFESILDSGTRLPHGATVHGRTVTPEHRGERAWSRRACACVCDPLESVTNRLPSWVRLSARQMGYLAGGTVLLVALLWSYWPTFVDLYGIWRRNDEYSAGLLVPFLTAYVVWSWRGDLREVPVHPAVVAGIVLFGLAQAMRGLGLILLLRSAEGVSLILSVAAMVLLLLGWRVLRKLAPALLFLCLMLPWPNRVQAALALPLQRWATTSAVFCLELAGYEVARDGNVIKIGDTSVAVAEACNGLRMITAFVVISGLVVLLTRRAWWEKLLVLLSSLPIALLCNTLRLTVTAVAFTFLKGEHVEKAFHDFGGYAMMPLALAMVVGELWFLSRLTTPPAEVSPAVIARRQPRQISHS